MSELQRMAVGTKSLLTSGIHIAQYTALVLTTD